MVSSNFHPDLLVTQAVPSIMLSKTAVLQEDDGAFDQRDQRRHSGSNSVLPVAGATPFVGVGDDVDAAVDLEVNDVEREAGDTTCVDAWCAAPVPVEAPN